MIRCAEAKNTDRIFSLYLALHIADCKLQKKMSKKIDLLLVISYGHRPKKYDNRHTVKNIKKQITNTLAQTSQKYENKKVS